MDQIQQQNNAYVLLTIQPTNISSSKRKNLPLRIFTFLLFVSVAGINEICAISGLKDVSDKYDLYVTPPSPYYIIWPIIYLGLLLVNILNLIKNYWDAKAHLFYAISNIFTIVWALTWIRGTITSCAIASLLQSIIVTFVFLLWVQLGKDYSPTTKLWTYFERNCFSLYFGWLFASFILGVGVDLVYLWGLTQKQNLIVFWIITPLLFAGFAAWVAVKEGIVGILSFLGFGISGIWAVIGAAIKSDYCLNQINGEC